MLAGARFAQQPIQISSGIAVADSSQNTFFKVILNQSITSLTFSPQPAIQKQITIIFAQDATRYPMAATESSARKIAAD